MRRLDVVKLLCILSLIFLTLQFVVLPIVFRVKDKQGEELTAESTKKPISRFLSKVRLHDAPIFLCDPDILELIDRLSADHVTDIRTYLSDRRVVSFGVLDDHWTATKSELFFGALPKSGFKVNRVKEAVAFPIRNATNPKNRVTTHYFLSRNELVIHLVIFYSRPTGFLWHGSLDFTKLEKKPVDDSKLKHWKHEGAFEKIAVKHLTLDSDKLLVPEPIIDFLSQVKDSVFTPCNQTRAREFLQKYPQDESDEAKRFTRKARQIVARAKQYLDDLGIPFWLSSGTCLGWFRQCDIITYSKDVDIGIRIEDYKPELIPTFERGGFYLHLVFGKVSDSYEMSFQAGDIKLDLFFFYEESDHMWNGGTHDLDGQKYKYIFPKFSFSWTVFLGLKVRVPYPALPYVEANYGVNWSEPVKNWEWNKSPPNVRENGFWPKEEWDTVIQIY